MDLSWSANGRIRGDGVGVGESASGRYAMRGASKIVEAEIGVLPASSSFQRRDSTTASSRSRCYRTGGRPYALCMGPDRNAGTLWSMTIDSEDRCAVGAADAIEPPALGASKSGACQQRLTAKTVGVYIRAKTLKVTWYVATFKGPRADDLDTPQRLTADDLSESANIVGCLQLDSVILQTVTEASSVEDIDSNYAERHLRHREEGRATWGKCHSPQRQSGFCSWHVRRQIGPLLLLVNSGGGRHGLRPSSPARTSFTTHADYTPVASLSSATEKTMSSSIRTRCVAEGVSCFESPPVQGT